MKPRCSAVVEKARDSLWNCRYACKATNSRPVTLQIYTLPSTIPFSISPFLILNDLE